MVQRRERIGRGSNVYAGPVVTKNLPGTQYDGAVHSTPSHGFSVGNTDPIGPPLNYYAAPDFAAYYFAEALGQHQNNVSLPQFNSVTAYGCSPAKPDSTTNWPFPDNLLHAVAGDTGEIGFDVAANVADPPAHPVLRPDGRAVHQVVDLAVQLQRHPGVAQRRQFVLQLQRARPRRAIGSHGPGANHAEFLLDHLREASTRTWSPSIPSS